MRFIRILLLVGAANACSNGTPRNPEVVAAENYERQKPLLLPAGGGYYGSVEIQVLNYSPGLEYSVGGPFVPLLSPVIALRATAEITVRSIIVPELATSDTYTVASAFPGIAISPPPGSLNHAATVTLTTPLKNLRLEIQAADSFIPYDAESGIIVSETSTITARQCSPSQCSAPVTFTYTMAPPVINPPVPPRSRALTKSEIQDFVNRAAERYSQTKTNGLASLLDDAKAAVIKNPALITNAALRQRFLSQDNLTTAAEACTTVSRYLYAEALRLGLSNSALPALPDFPHYYIRHIVSGDITVDSGGRNFVWVVNGPALVTPYLPAANLAPFDFARGSSYPTDYSLIEKLTAQAPWVTLLRDGPSGSSHTHTFAAIKNGNGYTMIDTYFDPFNGIELKASAGKAWPYAFRFGPAGSRYLHFVYGY